jgi:hypothetical protein
MLEMRLIDRARRGWDWEVRDEAGTLMACGRQRNRRAAKYQAARALFHLLNVTSCRPPNSIYNNTRGTSGRDTV